jgi:hypothetical protein
MVGARVPNQGAPRSFTSKNISYKSDLPQKNAKQVGLGTDKTELYWK